MKGLAAQPIWTARLVLLPLRVEDSAEMATVLADPALHRFIGGEPLGPEALHDRYEGLVAGTSDPDVVWLNWVVRRQVDNALVGTVQATLGRSGPGWTGEVAWVVGTAWQGHGFATEAAAALVAWLLDQGVTTLVAHIHPDHLASARVAAAAGLTPTDVLQDGEVRWQRSAGPASGPGPS